MLGRMSKSKKNRVLLTPVLTRVQVKRSLLQLNSVKEAMSSVHMSTTKDLQKKDSTLKKCFDRVGKPIIRELRWRVLREEWVT